MHIPDGPLSVEISLSMAAAAAAGVGLSLYKLQQTHSTRTIPLTGMMASLVFAGQMVNFPLFLAPASGHLIGAVLASVVLGPWAGCVAITLVLIVQFLLFADGGLFALGANIFNMGIIGAWGGYAVYFSIRRFLCRFEKHAGSETLTIHPTASETPRATIAAAVLAAWVSVLAGSFMFCVEFSLSPESAGKYNLVNLFSWMAGIHSLVGIGEALITGVVISFVIAQRSDLIYLPGQTGTRMGHVGRVVWVGCIAALAVAAFLAPFASSYSDGLEAVAEKVGFAELEADSAALVLSEYEVPLPGAIQDSPFWQKVAVSIAGIGGTLAVLGIAAVLGNLFPREVAAETGTGDAG